MPDCTVTFSVGSPSWNLYMAMRDQGVKPEDIDTGYPLTDYAKKTRSVVGRGDYRIDETEVLNYALEHYEKFQLAIKETTGYDVPWSLDDLNPATDLDAKIRDQVSQAIVKFRQILSAKGLKEGDDRFNELLAVSLFAFVRSPKPKTVAAPAPLPKKVKQDLQSAGLEEVAEQLAASGGLGLSKRQKKCVLEETALGSLAKNCRSRSEENYVLHAVFRLAGLKAQSLLVPPNGGGAISLSLGRKTIIFDLYHELSDVGPDNANYRRAFWFEQTGAEHLAIYYNNLGATYLDEGKFQKGFTELKKSLAIDPHSRCCARKNLESGYDDLARREAGY